MLAALDIPLILEGSSVEKGDLDSEIKAVQQMLDTEVSH